VASAADAFVTTWCGVRGFESTRSMTVQVTLLPSGVIEMTFGEQIDLVQGIVAVSPGRTGNFSPLDLSASGRQGGGAAAAGERFSEATELDTVAVARKFYQTHGDNFDQLVFWADTTVVDGGTFAFESTIANSIRGIGAEVFNASRDFGSAGRLSSVLVMDRLGKYPDDPAALVLGENSTLGVLAHETGHRWLALLQFRNASGQTSDLLLGRQRAHWSFFFDSDASVMEGNDIEALGGGAFRTIGAAQRYSRLDMYAMGLATPAEVSPFFYVDSPINVQPDRNRESAPRTGVTFNGTRRDVLLQDVIDVLGARQPTAAESPRQHRQAFVYIVSRGATPGADVQKLDRIRRDWPAFFLQATEGRMTVETSLR
jgi:large repetitive protein